MIEEHFEHNPIDLFPFLYIILLMISFLSYLTVKYICYNSFSSNLYKTRVNWSLLVDILYTNLHFSYQTLFFSHVTEFTVAMFILLIKQIRFRFQESNDEGNTNDKQIIDKPIFLYEIVQYILKTIGI